MIQRYLSELYDWENLIKLQNVVKCHLYCEQYGKGAMVDANIMCESYSPLDYQ